MLPRRMKLKEIEENHKTSKDDSYTNLYDQIYDTKLVNLSTTELRCRSFQKFLSSSTQILTWEVGLGKIILPAIYYVPYFIEQCEKCYNPWAQAIFLNESKR